MITFKKITISNFLSFGNNPISIDLTTPDMTLILGMNHDTGSNGYSRNGVGKSTIFQAISFALFDQGYPNNNMKKDEFVNISNKKKMLVELEIDINGQEFIIKRGRKPNICEILRNGEPFTMHSIKTIDDMIVELLGINADIFFNTVMLTTNNIPFMGLKPAGQRDFMEILLTLHVLTNRANMIKLANKENAIDIKLENQNKDNHDANVIEKQSQVDSLKRRQQKFITDNITHKEDLTNHLTILNDINVDEILAIHQSNKSLTKSKETNQLELSKVEMKLGAELQKVITDFDDQLSELKNKFDVDNMKLKEDIHDLIKERGVGELEDKQTIEKNFSERRKEIQNMELELKQIDMDVKKNASDLETHISNIETLAKEMSDIEQGICPYCKQAYHSSDDHQTDLNNKIFTARDEQDAIQIVLEDLLQKEETLNETYTKQNKSLNKNYVNEITEIENYYEDLVGKAKDENNLKVEKLTETYTLNQSDITRKKSDMSDTVSAEYLLTIREIKGIIKNIDDTYVDKIELTEAECSEVANNKLIVEAELKQMESIEDPYVDQIKMIDDSINDYDYTILDDLQKKESHYKIMVKLLTDNKSFIRKNLIDQYIPFINDHISHYLQILDLPHRIEINSDLTVSIIYMNEKLSYGGLSNGEKGRVNFAISLAFRELVKHSISDFNCMFIDEVMDGQGIDQTGIHSILDILKTNSYNTFLISHREELIPEADQVITIEKKYGFSNVHDYDAVAIMNDFEKL